MLIVAYSKSIIESFLRSELSYYKQRKGFSYRPHNSLKEGLGTAESVVVRK